MPGGLYGGIAEGLQSGVQLGIGLRRQAMDEQQQQITNTRNASLDQERQREFGLRQQDYKEAHDYRNAQTDNQRAKIALDALEGEQKDISASGTALINQYGNWETVPPEQRATIGKAQYENQQKRQAILSHLTGGDVAKQTKGASDLLFGLQNGTASISADPKATTMAFQIAGGRPIQDYQAGPNGEPPVVLTAVQKVQQGIQSGDQSMLMDGANTLFAPILRQGIGEHTEDGGTIIKKELAGIDPHPDGPEHIIPRLNITVQYPDGTTKIGQAPMTEKRSGHSSDDKVQSIPVNDLMDYVSRQGALVQSINHPEVAAVVQDGIANGADKDYDKYLKAATLIGMDPKLVKKREIEFRTTNIGGQYLLDQNDKASGVLLHREIVQATPKPREFAPKESRDPIGYQPDGRGGLAPIPGGPADQPKRDKLQADALAMYHAAYPFGQRNDQPMSDPNAYVADYITKKGGGGVQGAPTAAPAQSAPSTPARAAAPQAAPVRAQAAATSKPAALPPRQPGESLGAYQARTGI